MLMTLVIINEIQEIRNGHLNVYENGSDTDGWADTTKDEAMACGSDTFIGSTQKKDGRRNWKKPTTAEMAVKARFRRRGGV